MAVDHPFSTSPPSRERGEAGCRVRRMPGRGEQPPPVRGKSTAGRSAGKESVKPSRPQQTTPHVHRKSNIKPIAVAQRRNGAYLPHAVPSGRPRILDVPRGPMPSGTPALHPGPGSTGPNGRPPGCAPCAHRGWELRDGSSGTPSARSRTPPSLPVGSTRTTGTRRCDAAVVVATTDARRHLRLPACPGTAACRAGAVALAVTTVSGFPAGAVRAVSGGQGPTRAGFPERAAGVPGSECSHSGSCPGVSVGVVVTLPGDRCGLRGGHTIRLSGVRAGFCPYLVREGFLCAYVS